MPEPVIDVSKHWVTTTFKRSVVEFEIESETSQVWDTPRTTAQVLDTDRTSTPKVISDSMLQRIAANLEDLTAQVTAQATPEVTPEVTPQVAARVTARVAARVVCLVSCKSPMTKTDKGQALRYL